MRAAPKLAQHRRPTDKEREDKGSVTTFKQERGAAYLAARIKRDAPEIAQAVERGEFKSMRAASIHRWRDYY